VKDTRGEAGSNKQVGDGGVSGRRGKRSRETMLVASGRGKRKLQIEEVRMGMVMTLGGTPLQSGRAALASKEDEGNHSTSALDIWRVTVGKCSEGRGKRV